MVIRSASRRRSIAAFAIVATASALGAIASAAPPDDRAVTEATLAELASSPRASAVSEMIARAKAATARAARLREAGDEQHARLADGLARTWADAAREVLRAIELEERASAAQVAATDAGAVADRERALLEEGVAQNGRLRAQLEALERESQQEPAKTSTAATADAGVAKPKPAAPKPAAAKPAPAADGGAR
jgi:hypothetical protein